MNPLRYLFLAITLVLCLSGCKHQYLVGYYTVPQFRQAIHWRTAVDEGYTANPQVLDSLKRVDSFEVKVFMAAWCSDSHRELPRFLRIAEQVPARVELIALDTSRHHRDPKGLSDSLQVHGTPTFIFYRRGQELGRIKVKPKGRMESDMYRLVKQ